jgi:hypothetical protein
VTDNNDIALHNLRRIRDEIDALIAARMAFGEVGVEWHAKRDFILHRSSFETRWSNLNGVAVELSIRYPDPNWAYREHQGAKP